MYNRSILIGRLTADPELRQTPNGVPVTSFSIAVNRPFTTKSGERQTDFINIVAWRGSAEFVCRYFNKGKLILVEGAIQTRNFVDKQGNNRTAFEVVADNVSFVGSKGESEGSGGGSYQPPVAQSEPQAPAPSYSSGSVDDFTELDDDSDLPF